MSERICAEPDTESTRLLVPSAQFIRRRHASRFVLSYGSSPSRADVSGWMFLTEVFQKIVNGIIK